MHGRALHLLLLGALMGGWLSLPAQGLVVNETQSLNDSTIADDDGEYPDWIEIYNPSADPFDLTDHFLSDDDLDPYKWSFPSVVVPAEGFLLIWASDKDRVSGNHIHTNFKLSSSGEAVVLSGPDGLLIDRMPPIDLQSDWSVGHQPDGTGPILYFDQPTPGSANTTPGLDDPLDPPVISVGPGFFDTAFLVELTSTDPAAEIRYTLDGSIPTENSALYTSSLLVDSRVGEPNGISEIPTNDPERLMDPSVFVQWVPPQSEVLKSTVLRARAFRYGHVPSTTATHSYFVGPGIANRYCFPVISLATAPENFFDDAIGIYVPGLAEEIEELNYFQHGVEWERPIHVEFFEPSGTLGFAANMGVRVHGAHSRELPIKSLRLYARSEYGTDEIAYPIFPDLSLPWVKRFVLRTAGQDQPFTYLADSLTQSVVEHLEIDTQGSRPAVVFLNGEYWGIHDIRERHDRYFVESHYGVDDDDVIVIKKEYGFEAEVQDGEPGEEWHYIFFEQFVQSFDMGYQPNYDYVTTQMDVESYRDFIVAAAFSGQLQWSARMWRKRTPSSDPDPPEEHDRRWRWMIFDLDFGFLDRNADVFSLGTLAAGEDLFSGLIANTGWRTGFINRYADQLNSAWLPATTLARIDALQTLFTPDLPEHMDRWQLPGYMFEHPGTMANWNTLMGYRRDFANARPSYARADIVDFFDLNGTWNLTLDVSDPTRGSIRINTLELEGSELPWQGVYFDGVPVTLEGRAAPGYAFSGWQGDAVGTDSPWQVLSDDDLSITAVFLPGAGVVPDGNLVAGIPLTIGRFPDGDLHLEWSASCMASDQDYSVYMGNLGDYSAQDPLECSTSGSTESRLELPDGDVYFLVAPHNGIAEGSYGNRSSGARRPTNPSSCRPQAFMPC